MNASRVLGGPYVALVGEVLYFICTLVDEDRVPYVYGMGPLRGQGTKRHQVERFLRLEEFPRIFSFGAPLKLGNMYGKLPRPRCGTESVGVYDGPPVATRALLSVDRNLVRSDC